MSQASKILKILKKNKRQGVANYEFARQGILRYGARIGELRKEGHNIYNERETLANGRKSNTFRYYLIDEEEKPRWFDKLKRIGVK